MLKTSEAEILKLILDIKQMLPQNITSALGDFSWEKRAHKISVNNESSLVTLNFYSDGLSLDLKSEIENLVRNNLLAHTKSVSVYFESLNKNKKPPQQQQQPRPQQQQQPQQGSGNGHSHSHSQTQQQDGKKSIPNVKRIIAVASGKGGVGKSTVSVNLAVALYNQGYKVGILDADIYGPSIPTMLNIHDDPKVNAQNKIIPPVSCGLKIMSFGFFAPEETAVIWRGPMVMKALQQFFWDVDWGELDFLIIDLPPGTGDAQLTLVQSIPLAGAVIVTTPQNVALLDAVKAIAMFQKTQIPILGLVENMSIFSCPSCGTESYIFGSGGGERVSNKFEVPLLGQIPIIPEIRAAGDLGEPLTLIPGHGVREKFGDIAEKAVMRVVALEAAARSAALKNISKQNQHAHDQKDGHVHDENCSHGHDHGHKHEHKHDGSCSHHDHKHDHKHEHVH